MGGGESRDTRPCHGKIFAARGYCRRTNGHPGPLPTRHFPFLCPQFFCQPRLCSRAAPSRAANQITPVPPRPARIGRAQVLASFRRSLPLHTLRPGTDRALLWLRLRRAVFTAPLRSIRSGSTGQVRLGHRASRRPFFPAGLALRAYDFCGYHSLIPPVPLLASAAHD